MTYGKALVALDTGEKLRVRGIPVIITGIATRRAVRYDKTTYLPYCNGDRYWSCTVQELSKGSHVYEVRVEEILTEEEYIEQIKEGDKNGEAEAS